MRLRLLFLIQNSRKLMLTIIIMLVSFWLQDLLDPIFYPINEYLRAEFPSALSRWITTVFTLLNTQVPLYLIILSSTLASVVIYFVRKFYRDRKIKISKLKILSAEYGSGSTFVNITDRLNDLVSDDKLRVTLSNGIPGIDPTPGLVKFAKIKYENAGRIEEEKVTEGKEIEIPK